MISTPHCECFVREVIAYYTYISYTIDLVVLGVGGHGGGLACEGRVPSSLWAVLQSQRETEFRPSALGETVVGAMRVGGRATFGAKMVSEGSHPQSKSVWYQTWSRMLAHM